MKETNPQREISNLTWLESASRKKKSWCRPRCRFATNPQPPGVRAVRRPSLPQQPRQALSKPPLPLPLPNRLLIWHTPIGKLAAIGAVLPRKIGCAPNRNCAPSYPLPDLVTSEVRQRIQNRLLTRVADRSRDRK